MPNGVPSDHGLEVDDLPGTIGEPLVLLINGIHVGSELLKPRTPDRFMPRESRYGNLESWALCGTASCQ